MFSFFRPKPLFNKLEQRQITTAIQTAEQRTSGEIRLYIESHCKYMDPVERAAEVFYGLRMNETLEHNGVLIYMAHKDHQLAIFGDEGIHRKTGTGFWQTEIEHIITQFNKENYVEGFVTVINEIGEALCTHFPFNGKSDKNELPDDIVFGK